MRHHPAIPLPTFTAHPDRAWILVVEIHTESLLSRWNANVFTEGERYVETMPSAMLNSGDAESVMVDHGATPEILDMWRTLDTDNPQYDHALWFALVSQPLSFCSSMLLQHLRSGDFDPETF